MIHSQNLKKANQRSQRVLEIVDDHLGKLAFVLFELPQRRVELLELVPLATLLRNRGRRPFQHLHLALAETKAHAQRVPQNGRWLLSAREGFDKRVDRPGIASLEARAGAGEE